MRREGEIEVSKKSGYSGKCDRFSSLLIYKKVDLNRYSPTSRCTQVLARSPGTADTITRGPILHTRSQFFLAFVDSGRRGKEKCLEYLLIFFSSLMSIIIHFIYFI